MIISHRLKFAFFRSPKTGSTTTELILRMCGVFDPEVDVCSEMTRYGMQGDVKALPHMSPIEAIEAGFLTIEQAREYTMYATLRDPLSRAVSVFGHAQGKIPAINNPEVFASEVLKSRDYGLLEKPQVDYFYVDGELVCKPVAFKDFVKSLKGLLKIIGKLPGASKPVDFPVIPNFNVTTGKMNNQNRQNWIDNSPDPKVKEHLLLKFADDAALYESFYGKLN